MDTQHIRETTKKVDRIEDRQIRSRGFYTSEASMAGMVLTTVSLVLVHLLMHAGQKPWAIAALCLAALGFALSVIDWLLFVPRRRNSPKNADKPNTTKTGHDHHPPTR
jgi:hypothetical protein